MILNTNKIDKFRRDNKVSQQKFSAKIGISTNGYQKIIESGKTTTETLLSIAQVMGVHPGELFSGDYKIDDNKPSKIEESPNKYAIPAKSCTSCAEKERTIRILENSVDDLRRELAAFNRSRNANTG